LEVPGRDHPVDLRVRERFRGVDRDDPGVRMRATQHGPVEHAGQDDVVEVGALAPDEARVLLALHGAVADRRLLRCGGGHPHLLAAARSCSAAHRTALTMLAYPVHRQMAPEIASLISASEGSGFSSNSARAVMIMPGVQKPHWRPC